MADQTILLTGSLTDCLYPLRRLVVWNEKNQTMNQKTPAQKWRPYLKNC
ncbi:hypothetical protein DFAR_2480001 [Desulfarculales bacterium]